MIGQTLGHYRIVEKIGAGGMGEVYRARPIGGTGVSPVAARRRFCKEALALSKLNHPHIETVHEFDTQGGAGKRREAQAALAKLAEQARRGYVSAYDIASVYAGLGENDRAFEWLEKAFAERSAFLIHGNWDPRFASLHPDPRFLDLLRRIGIPS